MTGRFVSNMDRGAALLAPQRTRFRIWAPAVAAVTLRIDGDSDQPMTALPGGWFEAEAPRGASTRYGFVLPDGTLIPDPASRFQAGDVHDLSVVIDPHAYRWQHTGWAGRPWHETVLYELHPGLCGGFRGVTDRLRDLADLGVTAVELMPIADFPGAHNWGYDGVLPFAPDTAYGTPEDLKILIDTAHGFGLMVFIDVVYNHFGPDGNYLGNYAPLFFRDDVHTPWGVAIDFRQREVRRYFTDNALYWLNEYRFDGIRFDAVHAIPEPEALDRMATDIRAGIEPGRQIHLVLEHDGNAAHHLRSDATGTGYDAQWNDDAHHCLHVLLTGDHEGYYADYAPNAAALLARCLEQGFAWQGEPSPHRDGELRGEPSGHLPPTAFVIFLQNHDQIGNRAMGERLLSLANPAAVRAATALLLLGPNIPLLFMGEEWGSRQPFLYFTDHEPDLAEAVRKGRRGEFSRFAAFADPVKREAIPDPNDPATFAASRPDPGEAAQSEHAGWFALYRRLLEIRRIEIVPRLIGATSLGASAIGDKGVCASWQLGDRSRLTIVVNLGADALHYPPAAGRVLFDTSDGDPSPGLLPPRNAVVFLEAPGS